MSAMPVFERHFPVDRVLSWEDLQTIPDEDHWAYEIIEGKLIVSPSPDSRHQSCVGSLYVLLRQACPPELKVMVAPFDYAPRPGYVLQPDVLIARRPVTGQRLESAPVLAVEVSSPSSRAMDTTLKRLVYEQQGVEHYWIVDPAGPSITALRLVDDAYAVVAQVSAGDVFEVTDPVAVAFDPATLLDE